MPSPWRTEYTADRKLRITPAETSDYLAGRTTITQLASTYGVTRHVMRSALRFMAIYRQT